MAVSIILNVGTKSIEWFLCIIESLMKQKLLQAFPALSIRNYQLYFGGQLISLIGTWLQNVAQGWLAEVTAVPVAIDVEHVLDRFKLLSLNHEAKLVLGKRHAGAKAYFLFLFHFGAQYRF